MKKQIYIFLVLISFVSIQFNSFGQTGGYFGKKTFIDFSLKGNFPAFIENSQKMDITHITGTQFEEKRKKFDYGTRIGINRSISSSFGIGVELGFDYFKLNRNPNSQFGNSYNAIIFHESYKVRANAFLVKLIFSSKNSLMPLGLSHQVGFGVSKYTIKKEELMYNTYLSPTTISSNRMLGTEKMVNAPKTFTLLYAIQLSTPLTKSLLLNYGIRYTLNITKKSALPYYNYASQEDFEKMNAAEFTRSLKDYRGLNLIQLQLGLTFAF